MPYIYFLKILLITLFQLFHAANVAGALIVNSIHPEPNYKLTKNKEDIDELTDNVIHKYPIWINRGSVGWASRTPVVIDVSLSKNILGGDLKILFAE